MTTITIRRSSTAFDEIAFWLLALAYALLGKIGLGGLFASVTTEAPARPAGHISRIVVATDGDDPDDPDDPDEDDEDEDDDDLDDEDDL